MAINIGAMYAPTAATKVTNYMLGKAGLSYVPQIPSLAHQYLDGTITPANQATLESLQAAQNFTVTLPLSVLLISISSPKLTTMDLVWHVCP